MGPSTFSTDGNNLAMVCIKKHPCVILMAMVYICKKNTPVLFDGHGLYWKKHPCVILMAINHGLYTVYN